MKFCSECAYPVSLQIPPDDNRERFVCANCGVVHYENPKLVIGTIPVWADGDQPCVLLCRRAIEPRYGYWTLPAGFMENGETTGEGAARETMEEAGARIELHELFSMLNVPYIHQVHLFYRATLLDLDYEEDSSCDTDMNLVMTAAGAFVEIQGTAEQEPFTRAELESLMGLAEQGIGQLSLLQQAALAGR